MRLTPCLFVLSRPTVYDVHHLTCMFSSQSFVKAQIDSQLRASNTMPNAATQTEPEMRVAVLRLKLWCECELNNPGRAVTPADIKAAPGKLRGQAMISMMRSLSEEQKINYNKCNNERARHIWVAEYMLDRNRLSESNYELRAAARHSRQTQRCGCRSDARGSRSSWWWQAPTSSKI